MTASATPCEPAWFSAPPYVETLGPEVAEVCELAGFVPDPEQRQALDAIFGIRADGTPSAKEAAIVAPRQNIKTGLFKECALGWLFVTDERLIIWSAHEFSTAQEAHRDLKELIEGSDVLRKRIYKIHDAHGQEGIELLSGQRVMFKARTRTGGRGLTGDKVVLDESFALRPGHMGSLVPTMSARPFGQIVYGSSAGLAESAVLRDIRDRGRGGDDPGLVYIEYADDLPGDCALGDKCTHVRGTKGCRLDDQRRWKRANPQYGRRIGVEAIELERRSLPPEEFGRERLGWWDEPAEDEEAEPAIEPKVWADRRDANSRSLNPVVLGIDVSPARVASLTAAAWREDGRKHGELIQSAKGTGWVVPTLLKIVEQVDPAALVIDAAGPAGSLIPEIEAAGLEVTITNSSQRAAADVGLVDDLEQDAICVVPCPPLDDAADTATWRTSGDKKYFNRRHGGGDISALVALSLARFGLLTVAAQPRKAPPAAPQAVKAGDELTAAGVGDLQTVGF